MIMKWRGRALTSCTGRRAPWLALPAVAAAAIAGLVAPAPAQAAIPAGAITPSTVTCADFIGGSPTTLTSVRYGTNGTTITSVTPTSFRYYTSVTAPSTYFRVSIPQTIQAGQTGPVLRMASITVYTSTCASFTRISYTRTGGSGLLTFLAATRGSVYVIAANYSASSVVGMAVPDPTTATYNFDALLNGTAVAGAAQSLTLAPAPTVTTTLSSTAITAGDSVTDSSTLSGATGTPTGSVEYRYYDTLGACEADTGAFPGTAPSGGTAAGGGALVAGAPPDSDSTAFATAGTYYWAVFYTSGDATNASAASDCSEVLTVTPAVTTVLAPGTSVTAGTAVTDTATLTGTAATVTGTVYYRYFTGADAAAAQAACTTARNTFLGSTHTVTGSDAGDVAVTATGAQTASDAITFNTVGDYVWAAFYAGNAANGYAASACTDAAEGLTVAVATPTVGNGLTTTVQDTATLTGATSTAGGTVHYYYFTGVTAETDCGTAVTNFEDTGALPTGADVHTAGDKTVTNGVVPVSNSVLIADATGGFWTALYTGDTNNARAGATCTVTP